MMEKVSGFIIVWKLRFHTIINAPRGSHCSGMEECRLRDPPQAENPASQDSFLSYRKLCFHTIINALPLRRVRENVPRHILFYFIGKTAYGALLN